MGVTRIGSGGYELSGGVVAPTVALSPTKRADTTSEESGEAICSVSVTTQTSSDAATFPAISCSLSPTFGGCSGAVTNRLGRQA